MKSTNHKRENNPSDFIKIKSFSSKDTIKNRKPQTNNSEKVFGTQTSEKGLLSIIYKELL